jgi:EAL domain-containing protein (putative c-di-GMP-specific phosphodiesterase class I)
VRELLRSTASNTKDRRRLLIEVTESSALGNLESANVLLQMLRGAGFKVCIDDFGAGSASLDYVRSLAIDAVKIDGKYVRDIVSDRRAQTLVRHIVELCASLNLETIAERVETAETAAMLRRLGVDFGQGYHYGRPEAEPRALRACA